LLVIGLYIGEIIVTTAYHQNSKGDNQYRTWLLWWRGLLMASVIYVIHCYGFKVALLFIDENRNFCPEQYVQMTGDKLGQGVQRFLTQG